MQMKNEYFIPTLEELHVGYELELEDKFPSEWYEERITKYHSLELLSKWINSKEVRVPYLTKEQIEDEGWEWIRDFEYRYRYGNFRLFYYEDRKAIIDINGYFINIFKGKIKDINSFRKVIKLLGI